jgi:RNA polymerase sporulation-specific sigma factor
MAQGEGIPTSGPAAQTDNEPAADDELAADARAGHERSLTVLVDRYRPMVWGMASDRYLPGGDREDLVQEGMIGLWHAIRDHDPAIAPFGPFARLCVDRQMWGAVTKANRQRHRVLQEAGVLEEWMDVPDTALDPANVVLAVDAVRDMTAHMRAALSTLERDVITMYVAGASYDRIAETLDVHRKGIDNALQRARRKILSYRESSVVLAA